MKGTKRIFSIIMVVALLLSSFSVAAATGYRDVPNTHWAKADIEWVTAKGLMNGTGTNTFSPEGTAERAMLVTVLYRSAGSPAVSARTPFTDLKEDWYKKSVAWAYANGIVNGNSPTTFAPSDKLTREQLATILYRYTKNTLKNNVTASGSLNKFPDAKKVSDYAKDAMLWANTVGLVNGSPINGVAHLQPQGNATRAQMATIFHRFDTFKEANKPTPTTTVPNFVGMTKAQATAAAKAAELSVLFQNADSHNADYAVDVVVGQQTGANTTVTVGATVILKVNVAPTLFAIPDFVGMTRTEATAAAINAGFGALFAAEDYDETKPENTVLRQTPAAGTMHPAGTVISLTLNKKPPEPEPVPPKTLRVASYNVKHFAHGSGINYQVFANEIKAINPDIIGLQEIDNGTDRSNGDDQMAEIAAATGYPYYYFGKSINTGGGGYGHGILSKYPIRSSETIKFKAQFGEERTVERHEIYVDMTDDQLSNGKTVVFYNTHLCYSGEDSNNNNIVVQQPNQMAEIFEMMDLDTYPILVGDMNIAPLDFKDVIDVTRYTPLNGGKTLTNTANTYPQGAGAYIPIDNIILSDNIEYLPTNKVPNGLTVNITNISDHNMVYTDILLKEEITVLPAGRVPDVAGKTLEEATDVLKAAGYQVAYAEGSSTEPDATVLTQSVASGKTLVLGETVTLNAVKEATVPNVVGLSPAAAKELLEAKGYVVSFVNGSETEASEAVITLQSPASGKALAPGGTVTLTARVLYPEYLTVASYDVKKFKLEMTTSAVDYDAFAEEIAALNPDILCLQAVEEGTTANGNQTEKLAKLLGYNYYCFTPAIEAYNGGSFGNSVLSRFPIQSYSGGLFNKQKGETRGYARAVLDVCGVPVTVYNTMLNNSDSTVRSAQLAEITTMMAEDEFPILAGNLNMEPAVLEGKIDLNAYTPLNGGKELDQIYATFITETLVTYVSNIVVTDCFEVDVNQEHPTGLYISEVANCGHRMIWGNIRMKYAVQTENEPGTPKVPDLVGLTIAKAKAKAEAAGYVFSVAEGANQADGTTVSAQTPAAYYALTEGGTITVTTRELYGDYISVANFDVQKMGLTNYTSFADTIRELNPDIIGIQAIDHGTDQINVGCQLEHLAELLGYDYFVCGRAYDYKGGYLGNGILSKYPITKEESGLFENQTRETRGWIRAEINVEGTTIVAYNAKLAHGTSTEMATLRAKQFAEVYTMMEQDEFCLLMCNLSTDSSMLKGKFDEMRFTPLNGGKKLENTYVTASNGEASSSNIIICDEFEYITDPISAPYGLYIDNDKLCDHVMISSYIRLKNSVLPENSRFAEVPDFSGLTKDEAAALAAEKGLNVTFKIGFDQQSIDRVYTQSVQAGARLLKGSSVELMIGLELVDKTDYAGWLTIASYNVKNFAMGDQYDEIANEIRGVNADVIGLQEIDHFTGRNPEEQMEIIAEKAGYDYWYFGKSIDYGGGAYGHGIMSKYPITKSETVEFEDQYGENRSYERHEIYIDATDDGADNGFTIAFYNTHLCLDPSKATQNAQLNEILTQMEADPVPGILLGDMNAMPDQLKATVDATTVTMLHGGKEPYVTVVTCHNGKPIDNILITDDWEHFEYENGLGIMVSETEWSDHHMIYTYLKLK